MSAPISTITEAVPFVDEERPWPGLASYRERDQAYFRGREQEIRELTRAVTSQRLTVLFGASGLGKTSLLRAGLFPALRAGNELPVYIRLDFASEAGALSEQVVSEILSAAAAARVDAPARVAGETLWQYLHRRDAAFWSERNRLVRPVLVFDQFEEVFSLGLEHSQAAPRVQAFVHELADLVEGRPPLTLKERIEREIETAGQYDFAHHRYRVILSLREDFLASLEELRSQMPSLGSGRYRLLPMTGEQAFEVVNQTKGRLVEAAVARKIVRFAAGRPLDDEHTALSQLEIDPPLLGLFCRELNELRLAAGAPTITEELVRRNQGNIVEGFYESCMRTVAPALRRFVEDELVTQRGHRDSRAADDALTRPGVTPDDLTKLVNARLLRIEDRRGTRRIELTHDVLTGVVRLARDRRHAEERVESERAAERQRLEEEKRAAERERLEREAQLARVEAQRAREAERSSRLFRRLSGALALALAATLAAVWWANHQSQLAAERAVQEAAAFAALYNLHSAQTGAEATGKPGIALEAAPAIHDPELRAGEPGLKATPRPPQAASTGTQAVQGCTVKPRAYMHIGEEADRPYAQKLIPRLELQGFAVPGIERLDTMPRASEVRYFRKQEADGAALVVAALRRYGVNDAIVRYVRGYEDSKKLRSCHYEIWFSDAAF